MKKHGKYYKLVQKMSFFLTRIFRYINRHSPWCAAFTKEQLKILEYAEDLKYYYFSGYGNDVSKKIGCSLAKDLYDRFERTVTGKLTFLHGLKSGTVVLIQALFAIRYSMSIYTSGKFRFIFE